MGKGYRYIGVPTPRRDAREIVTGATAYLADRSFPNLLHGRVLRSPHAHARILRVEAERARALPGVKAVLTHADVPDWRGGTPRYVRPLDETVRYVGDAVALVAATTEAIAAEALGLIAVEYEVLPAVYDLEEALAPDAPQLYEQFPGNTLRSGTAWFGPKCLRDISFGDVERGFAEADIVVEGTCGYENLPNALPPECPGAVALWEEPDRVTLWLSSQGAYQDKVILYFAFGRNVHVRTIGGPCGGSYGSRYMSVPLQLQAAALSRATGRPVRLCLTKEEHMAAFGLRIESRIRGKVGMRRDGRVTAIAGDWLVGTGAYSLTTQAQVAVGCGEAQLAVRCANWDLRTKIVCANRAPSGIVRGFGGQELKCSLLPLLALGMEKLDLDPLQFFKTNYVKPGDTYLWRDGEEYTYRGTDYTRAMEEGARAFGWAEKWKGWLRPTSVDGARRTGVGVGVHGNADIGEDVSEAYVRLDPNGTATIYSAATEHGTGQPNNFCKMVAEVLQLPLDRIFLTPPDSDVVPYDFGPVGSRGTYAMGSAVIRAAEDALGELLRLAAPLLGVGVEELITVDGMIFAAADPAKKIRWNAAIGVDQTVLGKGRFHPDFTLANCMMSFVEVSVDADTGRVEILRVVNATDAGQIIDPQGLQNQLNGCLGSAGIDSALFEESVLDRATGHLLNANMVDYKWRTFAELPVIDNVVLETPVESHRFRAVGVGEVATAPGPMALVMAVSNAVGRRLYDYPVTPEKVLEALGKTQRRTPKKGRSA